MKMMVTADANWGIGKNGQLLVRIPADMKRLREETWGKTVIMGRKTYEMFEIGMPLAYETCIVLTENSAYENKKAVVVHSVKEALALVQDLPIEEVYCLGGAKTFEAFLPFCEEVYVTKIDYTYEANEYFPALDRLNHWKLVSSSEEQTYFDLEYEYRRYIKIE